mgnify:CR=1 FL=1
MSLLRQIAKSALQAILPRDAFVTRGRGSGVSLTFDDGPHPEHTPRLLDALAGARIQATFFIVGERAERHPELVRRIVDEGHELGNHTWSHSEPRHTSRRMFLEEITRTDELIQDLSLQATSLVRPPKGEVSLGKLCGLLSMQKTVVLWNRDTKDYRMNSAADMHAWCQSYVPKDGDIVLLHDDQPFALRSVERFRTLSQFEHISFRTVSEVIGKKMENALTR